MNDEGRSRDGGSGRGLWWVKLLHLSFDANASRTSEMLLFVDICNNTSESTVPVCRHDNTSESTLPWRVWVCTDALLMVEQRMRLKASAEILPSEGINLDYASS